MFLKSCHKCARTRVFCRHIFPAYFVGFLFSFFAVFFNFLHSVMKMKAYTVCTKAEASIFFWFSCHSVKEIVKLLNEVWMIYVSEQVVESKRLQKTHQGVYGRLFLNVWEMLSKKL